MTIEKVLYFIVTCDRCSAIEDNLTGVTLHQIRRQARKDGWSFGFDVLCPDCNGTTEIER